MSQLHSLKDIKALLDKASDDAVAEVDKRLERRKVANDNVAKAKTLPIPDQVKSDLKDRFRITRFRDIRKQPVVREYIVKGILNASEITEFVAKPGTAKSVLLADIGCHIAADLDWHGHAVKQGLVVFFAAERQALTERRIAAWAIKHNIKDIPFVVVGGPLNLTSGLVDTNVLAKTIADLSAEYRLPCSLVIIDTVTRTFGAGDQHQSRDMQKYIQSVDTLNRATKAHIALIHHSTWTEDRGKGAIDLDGAIDGSFGIAVKGKGPTKVFTLSGTGANDGSDEGPVMSFRLESVEVGTDTNGNPIDAPVVVPVDIVKPFDSADLKGNAAKALDSLRAVIDQDGECPPDGSPGFPDGVVMVKRDQWRDQFYADTKAKEATVTDDALSRRFRRAATELKEAGKIGECGQWVWLDMDKAGHGQD